MQNYNDFCTWPLLLGPGMKRLNLSTNFYLLRYFKLTCCMSFLLACIIQHYHEFCPGLMWIQLEVTHLYLTLSLTTKLEVFQPNLLYVDLSYVFESCNTAMIFAPNASGLWFMSILFSSFTTWGVSIKFAVCPPRVLCSRSTTMIFISDPWKPGTYIRRSQLGKDFL